MSREILLRYARPLAAVAILALLMWRCGAEPFLDGVRRLDLAAVALAVAVTALTTVASAWRWTVVAEALGLRLPLRQAVAAYCRSQLVNVTVPGGVVGDVERAVRHGRGTGRMGVAARSVAYERFGGQAVQVALTGAVLVAVPSAFREGAQWAMTTALVAAALLAAALVPLRRRGGRLRRARGPRLTDLRRLLGSPPVLVRVFLASAVVVSGHTAVVVVAARTSGSDLDPRTVVPLALVVLAGSAVPLNVAGWGPREGVAAAAFAAAGLGADAGLATAVAYGVLVVLATLPGLVVVGAQSARPLPGASRVAPSAAPAQVTADA